MLEVKAFYLVIKSIFICCADSRSVKCDFMCCMGVPSLSLDTIPPKTQANTSHASIYDELEIENLLWAILYLQSISDLYLPWITTCLHVGVCLGVCVCGQILPQG